MRHLQPDRQQHVSRGHRRGFHLQVHHRVQLEVSGDVPGAQHADLQHCLEPVRALRVLDVRRGVDGQDMGSQRHVSRGQWRRQKAGQVNRKYRARKYLQEAALHVRPQRASG